MNVPILSAGLAAVMALTGSLAVPVPAQNAAAVPSGTQLAVPSGTQLSPGQRVQVRSPRIVHWEQTGQLLSIDDSGLRIDYGNEETLELAWSDVDWLRVERGTRGAYWEGGILGLVVGLLVAEGIVAADRDDGQIDPSCGERHCYNPGFWATVGVAGAGAGAAVGKLLFKRTLWRDAPLPGGRGANVDAGLAWTNNQAELQLRLIR